MLFYEVYEMIVWYLIFVNKTSKLKFENSKELNLILLYVKHLYFKERSTMNDKSKLIESMTNLIQ